MEKRNYFRELLSEMGIKFNYNLIKQDDKEFHFIKAQSKNDNTHHESSVLATLLPKEKFIDEFLYEVALQKFSVYYAQSELWKENKLKK